MLIEAQRNDRNYLIANEIAPGANSMVSAAHGEIDLKYDGSHPAINGFINRVCNAKVKTFQGHYRP